MKQNKLTTLMGLLLILVFVLTACSPAATATPAAVEPTAAVPAEATAEEAAAAPTEAPAPVENTEAAAPLKVAILLPGSANDQSWNQLGYEAIQLVGSELGAEIAYSENVGNTDAPDALRDYASKGFQVIFGHGGQYEEAMLNVGPEFPETTFIVIAGAKGGGTNVVATDTAPWQYGYAYGWMAGKLTKSNRVGFVTALEGMQTMNNLVGGWKAGVKAANPAATTCVVYLKDMQDVAAAREATTAMVDDGEDVVEHELNAASQGVIDVAAEKGIWTVGRNADQVKGAPDAVMTTAQFAWGPKFVQLVQEAQAGTLKPGFFAFGYHTEVPGFTFVYDETHAWNPKIPTELVDQLDKEVGGLFRTNPMMEFTVEDAKGGCE